MKEEFHILTQFKNRNFRAVILLVMALVGLCFVFHPKSTRNKEKWLFIYYMSYDNDLYICGDKIIKMLEKGVVNPNQSVVIQADFPDSTKMKRILVQRSGWKTIRKNSLAESDESASTEELAKYLDWVLKNFKSDNYVLAFLDHGGMLNQMCLDATSDKWMNSMEAGKVCAEFNKKTGGKVRLLFLQQCGRSSIQNIFSFKDSAEFILSSPVPVGAPNTYYTKMLEKVSESTSMDGKPLAELIMKYDEHYGIYTLVRSAELAKLAEKIAPLAEAFKAEKPKAVPKELKPVFEHVDEKNYDLRDFLMAVTPPGENAKRASEEFLSWYEKKLVVAKKANVKNLQNCSGLSIFVPSQKKQTTRYDYLPVYKDTKIKDLTQSVLSEQQNK